MHNEDELPEPTLTVNRLLAWIVVSLILWATLIHGAIKVWEFIV